MNKLYEEMIQKLVQYGKESNLIQSEILIGSQSRNIMLADEYSDLDLIFFVTDLDYFMKTKEWINNLGKSYIDFTEETVCGGMERRVIFENAMDADFLFLKSDDMSKINELAAIVARSYQVLLDKSNFTEVIHHLAISHRSYCKPSESAVKNLIQEFWFHVIWATKKVLRGELWSAITCVNSHMKEMLLKMIEHHSHACYGEQYDTWHSGRMMKHWAKPWVTKEFENIYATYSEKEIFKAVVATMNLFRKVAMETSEIWNYPYPLESDQYASNWLHTLLVEKI